MVFLSLGLRAIVNVEALNMVESVGNVTRHRKATIVFKRGDTYVIRVVPAISGETIAHAYQAWIAELAKKHGMPLCEYCERGELLKHCDAKLFGNKPWEQNLKNTVSGKNYDPHTVETEIVKNCVVEDLGGFLFPGAIPVKRTSRFQTGYMIPALDALEKCAVEPQFHVRQSPSQAKGEQAQAQMIYYVEVASAPYVLTFNLDVSGIGKTSMLKVEEVVPRESRERRVELAFKALGLMLDNKIFGAKLSRFSPVSEYEVVLATVSKEIPFVVSTPASKDFVTRTISRLEKFSSTTGSDVKALIYAHSELGKEYLKHAEGRVETCDSILDLVEKALEISKNWLV